MASKFAGRKKEYRYFDKKYTADIGFEVFGDSVEGLFVAAGEAVMNAMVPDLGTIEKREKRSIRVEAESLEMLLFDFLQELIFYKDAEQLLLLAQEVTVVKKQGGGLELTASAYGEALEARRHELLVDVKAVTLHDFELKPTDSGWRAVVVLDI